MSEPNMELEDWLDDLCVRFIINLPAEDLSAVARICFQVEEAQWFYEDFIRPLDPTLPSMSLRRFCLRIFQHCPLLSSFSVEDHMKAFDDFLTYKTRVPVRGAIMLNTAMDSAVLVKGWKKGANWSFPRGKINKDEDDLDCAIREVYEETGFDLRCANLVPKNEDIFFIEMNIREQQLRLYVFRDVPQDTYFEPKTRKEISKIQWYKLSELPAFRRKGKDAQDDAVAAANTNKFYMVAPFLVQLKKWVVQQKRREAARGASNLAAAAATQPKLEEGLTVISSASHAHEGHHNGQPGGAAAKDIHEGTTRDLRCSLNVQPQSGMVAQQSPPAVVTASTASGSGLASHALLAPSAAQTAQPGLADGSSTLLAMLQQPPHTRETRIDQAADSAFQNPSTAHHGYPGRQLLTPNVAFSHHAVQNYARTSRDEFVTAQQLAGSGGHATNPILAASAPGRQPDFTTAQHPRPIPTQDRHIVSYPHLTTPSHGVAGSHAPVIPAFVQDARHDSANASSGFQSGRGVIGALQPAFAGDSQAPPLHTLLNSHSMSLLSAFKTKANGSGYTEPQGPSKSAAPGAVEAHGSQPGLAATEAQMQAQAQTGILSKRPADQHHLTALLGIFKSQTQTQAACASPLAGTVDGPSSSTSGVPEVSRLLQEKLLSDGLERPQHQASSHPTSSAETIRAAAEANGGPIQLDPNLHLPFGALKLLSRPKDLQRGDAPLPVRDASLPKGSSTSNTTVQSIHDHVPQTLQTQQAPAQHSRGYPESSGLATAPAPSLRPPFPDPKHAAGLLDLPATAPGADLLMRHLKDTPQSLTNKDHHVSQPNAEQKNKLLSLFGMPPSITPIESPVHDVRGNGQIIASSGPAPRSSSMSGASHALDYSGPRPHQDNSISTAPGMFNHVPAPRASTETPISQTDRNFLISFLQDVSNSSNRY